MRTRTSLAAAAVLLTTAGLIVQSPAQANKDVISTANPVQDRYIVVLKDGVSLSSFTKVAGSKLKSYRSINGFSVKATKAEARRMANDPSVKNVYQDGRVKINTNQPIPAPPDSPWGLNRIDQRKFPGFNAAGTYNWTSDGTGAHAYVVDTGIRETHEEFQTDGVSRATFDYTASFATDPGVDCHGHGTHVAGIIGGNTYGVAKNVTIHGVKVLDCEGSGYNSDVIEGIDWVTYNAIKPAVGNMSLGGFYDGLINDAVTASTMQGITWVVAAGNEGDDACYYSPSSAPTAITVGATGDLSETEPIGDWMANFSNWGECVDIFAPGAMIKSSFIDSDTDFRTWSGTSMAAPHATGVAALILQSAPAMSPAEVRNYMVNISTKGIIPLIDEFPGTPNRLLYSGNTPSLTVNASPEPIKCTRNVTVKGSLTLQGGALANRTVEIWYNRKGPVTPVKRATVVTNSTGAYTKSLSQAYDGYWYVKYRGQPLIPAKTSPNDYVDCSNK